MHTKTVTLENGTVATINHNADWSGAATITWLDGAQKALIPGAVLRECARDAVISEVQSLLESVRGDTLDDRMRIAAIEFAAYEVLIAWTINKTGQALDRKIVSLAKVLERSAKPAALIAAVLGELAYDETTAEETHILLKAESVLREKVREAKEDEAREQAAASTPHIETHPSPSRPFILRYGYTAQYGHAVYELRDHEFSTNRCMIQLHDWIVRTPLDEKRTVDPLKRWPMIFHQTLHGTLMVQETARDLFREALLG